MTESFFGPLALSLAATCLVAAFLARRSGSDARDVRLMMGIGAALGGASLVFLSLLDFV